MPRPTPQDRIRQALSGTVPASVLERLPPYVRYGDVLLLEGPLEGEAALVEAYAQILRCRSVLVSEGSIEGEFRRPRVRLAWGDPNTETIHQENGIRYAFDPTRLMFSPGNLPERQRVATWDCRGEIVVDFFAGIGYFTLPIAKRTGARRVIACEKNPESYRYLERNVALNEVEGIVEPRLGDNRDAAPRGEADRVLLGYLHDTLAFVPRAVDALKSEGGFLHVHTKGPEEAFPQREFDRVQRIVEEQGRRAQLRNAVVVKSYAPRVVHGVLDVEVRP